MNLPSPTFTVAHRRILLVLGCAILTAAAAASMLGTLGCVPPAPPSTIPMRELRATTAPTAPDRCLVVILPGLNFVPEAVEQAGFTDVLRDARVAADVTIADAHFGYYADHSIVERVDEDLVVPGLEAGYAKVWLVGISLGGLGALAYGAAHADRLAGIILLSPYLGRGDIMDDVRDRGGAVGWRQAHADELATRDDGEFWRGDDDRFFRAVWSFASEPRRADGSEIPVYMGYGRYDFLERDQRLLAPAIDEDRLVLAYGAHSVPVFLDLFKLFAKQGFLQRSCGRDADETHPARAPVATP